MSEAEVARLADVLGRSDVWCRLGGTSLGPKSDTSPLGPVQWIAATPTGFVAAMTVGGSLVPGGTGSAIDLVTIAKAARRHTNKHLLWT